MRSHRVTMLWIVALLLSAAAVAPEVSARGPAPRWIPRDVLVEYVVREADRGEESAMKLTIFRDGRVRYGSGRSGQIAVLCSEELRYLRRDLAEAGDGFVRSEDGLIRGVGFRLGGRGRGSQLLVLRPGDAGIRPDRQEQRHRRLLQRLDRLLDTASRQGEGPSVCPGRSPCATADSVLVAVLCNLVWSATTAIGAVLDGKWFSLR